MPLAGEVEPRCGCCVSRNVPARSGRRRRCPGRRERHPRARGQSCPPAPASGPGR